MMCNELDKANTSMNRRTDHGSEKLTINSSDPVICAEVETLVYTRMLLREARFPLLCATAKE